MNAHSASLNMPVLSKLRNLIRTSRSVARLSTLSGTPFSVRSMENRDVEDVYKLLDKQKWVMEKAYFANALKTDKREFVVAETASNKIIGCHGFLAHDPSSVHMGMWLVAASHRNNRVGHQMFKQLWHRFPEGANINTFVWPDAVRKIETRYDVSLHRSYMTYYNYGRVDPETLTPCSNENFRILPLSDVEMSDIIVYDSEIHQVPRGIYIRNWIQNENSKTYIAMRNNNVCGYGVLRSQGSFNQIAPLYADNDAIAKALLRNLVQHKLGQVIGFSSPHENISAIQFAANNKMLQRGDPLVNVYYRGEVKIDTRRVYAVSSNSFGNC